MEHDMAFKAQPDENGIIHTPPSEWDRRFLDMAKMVSTWSKDPRTGVGAVIVSPQKSVISTGFNGFPKQIKDDLALLNDRDHKLRLIIHAELNALHYALQDVTGCTLYTYPIPPCISCAASIIQRGIKHVVTVINDGHNPKWADENKMARALFEQAGITYQEYDRTILDMRSFS